MKTTDIFSARAGFTITATGSSARVLLDPKADPGSNGPLAVFYNAGSAPVYYAFGDVNVVAVVPGATPGPNCYCIPPGMLMVVRRDLAAYLAVITDGANQALYASLG